MFAAIENMINDDILNLYEGHEAVMQPLPPFLSSGASDVIYDFLLITIYQSLCIRWFNDREMGEKERVQGWGQIVNCWRISILSCFNIYISPSSRQF